ncbi:MAG TPA: hypothetical protein DE147_03545 [Gammaproteobacteria bacterium]|nr:hypothetical protein [Gammaproteobacteria bacterium]
MPEIYALISFGFPKISASHENKGGFMSHIKPATVLIIAVVALILDGIFIAAGVASISAALA